MRATFLQWVENTVSVLSEGLDSYRNNDTDTPIARDSPAENQILFTRILRICTAEKRPFQARGSGFVSAAFVCTVSFAAQFPPDGDAASRHGV